MGRLLSCPILAVQSIWTLSSVFAKYVKQKQDDLYIELANKYFTNGDFATAIDYYSRIINNQNGNQKRIFHLTVKFHFISYVCFEI